MGELSGLWSDGDSPETTLQKDKADSMKVDPEQEGKVKTHIEDVYADGINKKDNLPIFKVSHNEFFQNMSAGRQRLRFKTGSHTQKFMQGSKYKQSFYVQHEKDGYLRKVK